MATGITGIDGRVRAENAWRTAHVRSDSAVSTLFATVDGRCAVHVHQPGPDSTTAAIHHDRRDRVTRHALIGRRAADS